ncbi:Gfo/Idh/MocA family protein [Kribbella pittospori]|uniref:Gfo/Idh/MocA family protein n=1 Tax=Kribbella pittospori TaxID=722689 RepID=UPI0013F43A3A|nr:Gfo/Idh/MocA family oxidoreductase [Kribbella pittospori]
MFRPRIGIIGTGWWATRHHIPSLLASGQCDVAALADSDPQRLAVAAQHFGLAKTYATADEMFAGTELDGVIVAVPHCDHYPVVRTALVHDVHVLVEKPMTLLSVDAWDLVRLAGDRGLHLLVGFTYQYTKSARRCRDALQDGQIGDLMLVSGFYSSSAGIHYRGAAGAEGADAKYPLMKPQAATYRDPAVAGGGQGQTQLSHTAAMVSWATGQRPADVAAYMSDCDLPVDLVDAVSFRLESGAVGSVASTGSLPEGEVGHHELRYHGTAGHVIQNLRLGRVEVHRYGAGVEVIDAADEGAYPSQEPARTLVRLILGSGDNPAPGAAAAHATEFVEAAYRSRDLGRPVAITELDGQPQTTRQQDRS